MYSTHCLLVTVTLVLGVLLAASAASIRSHPADCRDVRLAGHTKSGIYKIHLNNNKTVEVYCDHGVNKTYTIVQQRMYGNENFQRNYNDYQIGFGKLSGGDFWIGLITMHHLTSQGNTMLDIQLQDWHGNNRYGTYRTFSLADRTDRFRLKIGGFTGTVVDDLSYSNGMQFATYDAPDYNRCAVNQRAGWWYNYCAYALLNGMYYSGGPYTPSAGYYDGIYWRDWLGFGYSLRFTRMMVSHPLP